MTTRVGFTNPQSTYEKMDMTNAKAKVLNESMTLSQNAALRSAWAAWFARWTSFYETKRNEFAGRFGNLFNSDELAAEADKYDQDLARFQVTLLQDNNAPPPDVTPPKQEESSTGIPLWGFVALVGGIALCVGGYIYYRKAKSAAFVKVLASARDALPSPDAFAQALPTASDCGCGRDIDIRPADPRAASKYLLSGL